MPSDIAVSRDRRALEVLILLGILGLMIAGVVVPGNLYHHYAREAARIQDARWEAEWIVEQVRQYQGIEGRNPDSLAELRRRVPQAAIEATDPWGRDWVASATDDVWICSRGPAATGSSHD